jgi:hypothetical protein
MADKLTPPSASPLERLNPTAELDALADVITEGAGGDNTDFREIVDLATRELLRRFRETPEDLPGTFVIKLVLDGLKAIAAQAVPEPDGPDTRSIIDNLDALPAVYALKIVDAELERVRAELAGLEAKREELT